MLDRNALHLKICTKCGAEYMGKYNSIQCSSCRKDVRQKAFDNFKQKNPSYWNEWSKRNRQKIHIGNIRRLYKLSKEDYEELKKSQENKCAICGKEAGSWASNGGHLLVDHDHATGVVRGLLCPYCNRALGQFFDSPTILQSAIDYISRRERSPA